MRKYPNFSEEKKLWKKGYKHIACLDEAGRGCLAGPVVAAAVKIKISNFQFLISKQIPNPKFQIQNLRDSKKLTSKKREEFYQVLTKNPFIEWGLGQVSEKVIDKINILEATKLAMKKAISKIFNFQFSIFNSDVFLILDGNFKLDLPIPQKSIVKADEKVFSCACASILAKVWRDRIMKRYHKKYPQYGFDKHKGYPTKYHIKMLKKFGPSVIHRLTYKPVSIIV